MDTPDTQRDIWVLRTTPDGRPAPGAKAAPYLRTPFNEYAPRFAPGPSPKWVAYQSDESGRMEVYVASFPDPRRRLQITTGGGSFPQWAPDGRELFYVASDGQLMSVRLTAGPDGLEPSTAQALFPLSGSTWASSPYDVSPDGQRFLVLATTEGSTLEAVVNWPAMLRRNGE